MTDEQFRISRRHLGLGAAAVGVGLTGLAPTAMATPRKPVRPDANKMVVTTLGTGSPVPSIERMGNSTLVQAAGYNLIFDGGRGIPIRLVQMGLSCGEIHGIFITHYHSDHVNGVSDTWMMGYIPALGARTGAFHLYGPQGINKLADGLRIAHADDIRVRVADKEVNPANTVIESHEYGVEGIVFNRDGLRVRVFEVDHDPADAIKPAVGYRIDYRGQSVLISGDTRPTPNLIKWARGVDLLIHEVADFPDPTLPLVQGVYAHHTSPQQAGQIFAETKPRMAAYSHIVAGVPATGYVSIDTIIARTREHYDGPLTVSEDLTQYTLTNHGIEVRRLI